MATRTIYFDLDKSGTPENGDVSLLTNKDAVSASILNIISTEPKERPYKQRDFGARLRRFLFEPVDRVTAIDMLEEIETAINRWESRAKNLNVEITPLEDEQTFKIKINATTDESNKPIEVETTLERIR